MLKLPLMVFLGILVVFGIIYFAMQSGTVKTGQNSDIMASLSQPTPTPAPLLVASGTPQPSQEQNLPTQGPEKPMDTQSENTTKATIKTSKGDIVISFFNDVAPNTVKNFATKSQSGFYNNLTFHRVEDWVIQGGDPSGNGTGGGSKPVEFNKKPFVTGAVGVASRGDGRTENDAQFFITKSDATWLNGQYTNFGQVTEGMDVVNKIAIGDKIISVTLE
jgi:peptidyl-prolyl cis-trans isomerase B (cyclophilin B)